MAKSYNFFLCFLKSEPEQTEYERNEIIIYFDYLT